MCASHWFNTPACRNDGMTGEIEGNILIFIYFAYDGKIDRNILVIGRTDCGKTSFIERLVVNNIFVKLTKAE